MVRDCKWAHAIIHGTIKTLLLLQNLKTNYVISLYMSIQDELNSSCTFHWEIELFVVAIFLEPVHVPINAWDQYYQVS